MITVYKYEIPIEDTARINAPRGAIFRHVDTQYEKPMVWAEVDTCLELTEHVLHVRGTGHPFTGDEGDHLGSLMLNGGDIVLHIYKDRSR